MLNTNLTKEDVVDRMLELALYLAKHNDYEEANYIEIELNGYRLRFSIKAGGKNDDR